jgi:HEPN domain-containing protein
VLILRDVEFPYVHDLLRLLLLAEEHGVYGAQKLARAGSLARFAVSGSYPGGQPPPTREVYEEALLLAESVLAWAESVVADAHP